MLQIWAEVTQANSPGAAIDSNRTTAFSKRRSLTTSVRLRRPCLLRAAMISPSSLPVLPSIGLISGARRDPSPSLSRFCAPCSTRRESAIAGAAQAKAFTRRRRGGLAGRCWRTGSYQVTRHPGARHAYRALSCEPGAREIPPPRLGALAERQPWFAGVRPRARGQRASRRRGGQLEPPRER